MGWTKWLKYSTYEYGQVHTRELVLQDARYMGKIFIIIAVIMSGILGIVIFDPETRYDSGMDNLPKLLITIASAVVGYILTVIPIKSEKALLIERRLVRAYFCLLLWILSGLEFLLSDAKADGVYVYLIYCAIVITTMHINPMAFLLQNIIFLAVVVPGLYEYYHSIGTMCSFCALIFAVTFLNFETNITVQKKLRNIDAVAAHKAALEKELQEKTAAVISGMQKQTAIQENVILAIADLVENRDTDTGTHVKATSYYVELIAKKAKEAGLYPEIIDDRFIYLVEKSAPMHDLGKIMIPDDILKAPRRLTTQEFEVMKRHTVEGARIIKHVYSNIETEDYIQCAANIANYHHERWDGNGYPERLMGENIPLEARIMSIADVFDALVSHRCYKDAYPIGEAFDEIERNAGSQFDPKLAKIFIDSRQEIEARIVSNFNEE